MKIETRSWLTAFGITFCAAAGASIVANHDSWKDPAVVILVVLGAAGAAFKDMRSSYRIPPVDSNDPKP